MKYHQISSTIILLFFSFCVSYAQTTYTAQTNGPTIWEATGSWVGGVVPTCGADSEINIIIPDGITVKVESEVNLSGCQVNITIENGGEIELFENQATDNAIISLGDGSTITLEGDGTISAASIGGADGDVSDHTISIDGTEVYSGDDGVVTGPGTIDETSVNGSLPVDFYTFACAMEDDKIVLNWTTASELNNSGFYVQASNNKNSFDDLYFIEGHGTSSEFNDYTFRSASIFQYYRLKQVDYDGDFEYSNVISINNTGENFSKPLYAPNPIVSGQEINMYLPLQQLTYFSLSIYNMTGKQMQLIEGSIFNKRDIYLEQLASGIYLFETKIGTQTFKQRVVIK